VAKLGTTQRPAVLRVQSMERADEIIAMAEHNGWKVIVGVEPDKPENTADLETLMQGGAAPIRRPPSTRLFESTDNKLGDESGLFRNLEA